MIILANVLLSIIGSSLLALNSKSFRFWGSLILFIAAIVWVIYGLCIFNIAIIIQFIAYIVINLIGMKSNNIFKSEAVEK